MLNSYTYYRYSRLGFTTKIPSAFYKDNEFFYNSLSIEHNKIEYILDDGGLCEDTFDDSEVIFLMLCFTKMLSTTAHLHVCYVKDLIEEALNKEIQVHVSGDESMIVIDFMDIDVSLCAFYVMPYGSMIDTYNMLRPWAKREVPENTTYQIPTLEVYSKKLKNVNFNDAGLEYVHRFGK